MADELIILDAMAPCRTRHFRASPSLPFWLSAIFKFVLTELSIFNMATGAVLKPNIKFELALSAILNMATSAVF